MSKDCQNIPLANVFEESSHFMPLVSVFTVLKQQKTRRLFNEIAEK